MRPIVIADVQRLFDQQRAKAGAVEEQVALDPLATIERQRGDIAGLSVQFDAGDLSFDPRRPVALGHTPQEATVKR